MYQIHLNFCSLQKKGALAVLNTTKAPIILESIFNLPLLNRLFKQSRSPAYPLKKDRFLCYVRIYKLNSLIGQFLLQVDRNCGALPRCAGDT